MQISRFQFFHVPCYQSALIFESFPRLDYQASTDYVIKKQLLVLKKGKKSKQV